MTAQWKPIIVYELCYLQSIGLGQTIGLENGMFFTLPLPFALTQTKFLRWVPVAKNDNYFLFAAKEDFFALKSTPVADYLNVVRQWPDSPPQSNSLDKAPERGPNVTRA